MSRSAIYAVNTTAGSAVSAGSAIPITGINRRFGCNCQLLGNTILLRGGGYYGVQASASLTATAAGTVTLTLYQDGNPVPGATATATAAAAGDVVALSVAPLVRVFEDASSVLTLVVSSQNVTTYNAAVAVEKK